MKKTKIALSVMGLIAATVSTFMGTSIEGASGFANGLYRIFLILGGLFMIPAGQTIFARLFGQADDMHAGGSFLHTAFYGGRFALGATVGTASRLIGGGIKLGKGISGGIGRMKGKDKNEDKTDKFTESETPSDSGGEEKS